MKEITSNEQEEKKLISEIQEISEIYDKHLFDDLCDIVVEEVKNNSLLSFESKGNIEKYIKLIVCEFIQKNFELKSIIHLSKHPKNILTNEFGEVVVSPPSFEAINSKDYDNFNDRITNLKQANITITYDNFKCAESLDSYGWGERRRMSAGMERTDASVESG